MSEPPNSSETSAESGAESTFEEALERLEVLVEQLEEGQLTLDKSLAHYQEGVTHLKSCYRALERAERKIEILTATDDSGQERTEAFEEPDMSLEEKRQSRSRRRSSTKSRSPRTDSPDPSVDVDEPGSLF